MLLGGQPHRHGDIPAQAPSRHCLRWSSGVVHTHPDVLMVACLGTCENMVANKEGSQKEAGDQRASTEARKGGRDPDCCQWQEEGGASHRSLSPPKKKSRKDDNEQESL